MVKITETAINQITKEYQDILQTGEIPLIRLTMELCWGGPKLRLALEESASDDDEIIEQSGVQFLVKNKDQAYLDHAKIDYVKNVFGQGQYLVLRI